MSVSRTFRETEIFCTRATFVARPLLTDTPGRATLHQLGRLIRRVHDVIRFVISDIASSGTLRITSGRDVEIISASRARHVRDDI